MKLIVTTLLCITGTLFNAFGQDTKLIQAFSKSYKFEKEKDYYSAITTLRGVYDSTHYETNLRLGWLNYNAGFYKKSLSYYKTATNLLPKSEEAKLGYAAPAYAAESTEHMIKLYKDILELNPANTAVCNNLGLIYYNKGDYKNAILNFKKITELYPFDYDGLLMSAWSNYRLGNKQDAISLFTKVLYYSPNDASAKEGIALCNGDISHALETLSAFSKSYSFALSNDYKSAISALLTIYTKDSYEINLRLGYLHYLAGLNKEAIDYYKIAIQLNPKALEPRLGYVYPAAALGQVNELIEQYNSILETDPLNTTANYRLGYLYYQRKDFTSAHKYLTRVVQLYPFSYDGLILFAKTNQQLGNKAEAKTGFNRVLLLVPDDKDAREALTTIK